MFFFPQSFSSGLVNLCKLCLLLSKPLILLKLQFNTLTTNLLPFKNQTTYSNPFVTV